QRIAGAGAVAGRGHAAGTGRCARWLARRSGRLRAAGRTLHRTASGTAPGHRGTCGRSRAAVSGARRGAQRVSVLVCGVDEAGRGPLCGSVVAAAVILDPARPIDGLADSKKLTARRREHLAALIRERAMAWAVAEADAGEIDRLNILHASLLAMRRAVEALALEPGLVRVDGNRCPELALPCEAVVGGDALV